MGSAAPNLNEKQVTAVEVVYGSGGANNTIQASINEYCVSGLGRIGLNCVVGYRSLPSCKTRQVSMDVVLGSTAISFLILSAVNAFQSILSSRQRQYKRDREWQSHEPPPETLPKLLLLRLL